METLIFDLQLFADNSTIAKDFAEFMLKKTEKGYPALCDTGLFEPDTKGFDPPANAYLTENWTIESEDGLKLSGVHYAPKNSKGQWVVMVTGYGQVGATMNLPAMAILALDYDVLVIDPRTSGSSEGDWLTMGVAECVDVALWTQKIAETNSNAQITLFGISMGAATVIMAAALSQTINVTSLIEDCGYANIYTLFDKFATLFAEEYGWTGTNKELYDEVVAYTKSQTGYDVSEAVPADSISNVTVPSLFIHGTADTLVSVDNVQTLYDASGATEKELWTVEGAGHAKSITEEPVNYLLKAGALIAGANEEIGASINSSASDTKFLGTIYDDTISVDGDNVTIEANTGVEDSISNGGNDLISSKGNNNSIKTGDGENTVIGFGNYYTIDGGAGDDYISISGEYFSVDAGEGDNIIKIYSSFNDTIISDSGNDSISVGKGDHLNISSGDGDDTITGTAFGIDEDDWSFGGYATIDAGAGDDYIAPLYSDNSSINAGDGNDTIINNGENSTLDGGDGNDYIEMTNAATGEYESALINGGAGNDTIYTKGSNTTIDSGEGNDSIRAIEADKISINAGEGDNYVFNAFAYYDEDGNFVSKYTFDENGNLVSRTNKNSKQSTAATILGGSGNDTLVNQGIDNATVDAGEGNNFIGLYHSYYNTITTGSGNDSVAVDKGHYVNVSTGAGDDSIVGRIGTIEEDSWAFGGYATIDAGAGNDYIAPIYSNNSSIYGGDGDDTIINNGKNTTIDGGAGNDYIELTNNYEGTTKDYEPQTIIASAGNDTISGYTSAAAIIGDFTSNELDGDDVIFTNGENTVKILDAKGKIIKLIDSNGNSNSTIIGGDGSMAIEKIENGNTFESNGVIYTAVDGDAELNVEGDVVTGITSGTVEATIKDAATTPTITFDGTTAFDFSADGSADNGLHVKIGDNSITYASGKATYTAENITYPAGEVQFKLTNPTSAMIFGNVAVTVPASGVTVPNGSSGNNIFWDILEDGVTISLSGGSVKGSVEASGGISYDTDNKVISLDKDASIKGKNIGTDENVTNFEITALNDTTVNIDGEGIIAKLVFKDGASIHVSGETFGTTADLTTTGGDLSFYFLPLLLQGGLSNITLTKDSTLTITPEGATAISITTAADDENATVSFEDTTFKVSTTNENGVTLSPAGSTEETLNVVGTVTVDSTNATFTFSKDAVVTSTIQSLPIKYVLETAGDYKINGNEFTTNADNVEVKLLNGDTVEFVEGAALKITDDEGNSIYEITVVSGTVDYKGNAITLNDGASMSMLDYEGLTSTINVSGGTYSLEVGDESATHTVGENATVTVAWNDDLTWKASNGTEVIDNYDGTLTLSKGATFETDDNKTTFILAEAGDYTINGNEITSTSDKVELKLSNNDTVEFDAKAGLTVNGQEYSGDEGTSFKVTKDGEVSMVMYKQGTATLDGQTFELTEDVEGGITVSGNKDDFTISHVITAEEVEEHDGPAEYIGKTFVEKYAVTGDTSYEVALNAEGVSALNNISSGATVTSTATMDGETTETFADVVTDSAGTFNFGENSYEITGDSSVTLSVAFANDGNGTVYEVADLNGSFEGKVGEEFAVNGTEIKVSQESNLTVLADDSSILVSGVAEGAEVTFDADNVEVLVTSETTVNGVTYKVEDDTDGVTVGKDGVTGLDKDAKLTITPAGTYKVNDTSLDVADGKTVVGTDSGAEILSNDTTLMTGEEKTVNGVTYKLEGEDADGVIISEDNKVTGLDKDGKITITNAGETVSINDTEITLENGNSLAVSSDGEKLTVSDVAEGAEVTFDADNVEVEVTSETTVNGVTYTVEDDADGVTVGKDGVTGLDKDAKLTITPEGTYKVNGTSLDVEEDQTVIGTDDGAEILLGDTILLTGEEKTVNGVTYKLEGNDSDGVVISKDNEVTGLDKDGKLTVTNAGETVSINDTEIKVTDGSVLTVSSDGEKLTVSDVTEGAEVSFDADNVEVLVTDETTVNDVTYKVESDSDGVTVSKDGVTSLDKNAKLTITPAGTYNVNGTSLNVKDGDTVIGVTDDYAYIKDANTPDFTSDTTTEEILDKLGIEEDKVTEMTDQEDVTLDNVKNNAVVVKEEATGDKTVALGNKGSAAIVENTDAPVTIAGGKGKDTLVSQGENVTFDMTEGGKDEIIATGGNITLENYDPTSNAGIQVTPEDLEAGVKLGDDKVKLANAEVNIGDTADNFVNLFMPDGKEVKVGFATENDNNVNASLSSSNMVLMGGGSYRGVSLDGDVINSELRGGNGNDSIYGGESAYIDAGAGKNYVEMSDKGGSTLNFSQGKTTVDGFNFVGGDATADTVQMGSVVLDSVKVADGDVILETANGNVRIKDAENKAIAFNNNYTDGDINLVVAKDELEVKENGYYVAAGKNAAVDISGYTGETANVNLGYSDYTDTDNLSFNGDVKDVNAKGFAGEATITGNDKNNAITASDGGSTIYGGAGKDTFTGGAGADEFVVGTGRKLIKDFNTDEDKVNVESAILQKVAAKDDNIIYTTENGTVTIEGAAGKMVEFENQYTDGSIQMQVADDEINVKENGYYLASGKNATVSLADYTGDSAVANLADQNFLNKDGLSFYGDIKELDATGYTGEAILYGNSGNNVITAGSGNSSLWGGDGGNDSLIGGAGEDTFFYGKGNGKDVVQGATAEDLVILSGISLSDLTATGEDIFSGNDLKFSINDGGSLTVKNGKTSGVAVEIDGTQYYVDDGEWQTK